MSCLYCDEKECGHTQPRIIEMLQNMQNDLVRIGKQAELMGLPVVHLVPVMTELDIAISRYRRTFRERR